MEYYEGVVKGFHWLFERTVDWRCGTRLVRARKKGSLAIHTSGHVGHQFIGNAGSYVRAVLRCATTKDMAVLRREHGVALRNCSCERRLYARGFTRMIGTMKNDEYSIIVVEMFLVISRIYTWLVIGEDEKIGERWRAVHWKYRLICRQECVIVRITVKNKSKSRFESSLTNDEP